MIVVKKKLKYIVITVLLILFIILIVCYYRTQIKEPFAVSDTNNLDVLLGEENGKLRKLFTDNIRDENFDIVYSTYKTSEFSSSNDANLFFFRYIPINNKFKIIGDLVETYKVDENTLEKDIKSSVITRDNVPQLLQPIINETKNAIVLTKKDLKDRIRINNSNSSKNTRDILKMMNYNNNSYNFNTIYNYYNGHLTDKNYNNLSSNQKFQSQDYITFNTSTLFGNNIINYIKKAKYKIINIFFIVFT